MAEKQALAVTSHVGRDLLQSASLFKSEDTVVWEYVVNGIQYIEQGKQPKMSVLVNPKARTIQISDNGKGMTEHDLQHFFTMHGENLERRAGRPGRGKFGTGKSAAFGIANKLKVDTRRGGLRNVVELTRQRIEQSKGESVPVNWVERNERTTLPDGTSITISDIRTKRIDTAPIIKYIERHLQTYRAISPQIAVNDHICEYREPRIAKEYTFEAGPEYQDTLGDIKLVVKVSQKPLDKSEQGVVVTAGLGNVVAKETCGVEHKEFGSYLLGEIDVPSLETYDTPLEAYDPSRSLQLNQNHPVASDLLGFIGSKLEYVRKECVRKLKEQQRSEAARRLKIEADKIAEILNQDFKQLQARLRDIKAASAVSGSVLSQFGPSTEADEAPGTWILGGDELGNLTERNKPDPGKGPQGRPDPELFPTGTPDIEGEYPVRPVGGQGKKQHAPHIGFHVEYRELGENENRSLYDAKALNIIINLSHPVVSAALNSSGVEDPVFKRLSYEIAFSEYAMALGYELIERDPNIPADDLLYEVRSTLNRVSTAAASLYKN